MARRSAAREAPSAFRRPLLLAACILGSAIVFIDSTVVNVALPALRADLHAGLADQQWVVDGYLLTLSALLLLGGSLGDVFERRRIFAIGVGGFGIASALCAASPSAPLLAVMRGLQGVFGALLVPSSLAVIAENFPAGRARAAAIGTWTAWTSAAVAFGPPLGGALVQLVSWRAVFALNVPLVAVNLWLIRRAVPVCARLPRRIDAAGAVLCTLALGGPIFALIEQPLRGFGSPLVLVPLLGGAALLALFVLYERRAADPMLPLALFGVREFSVVNAATLGVYGGLGAVTFVLAIYLQQVAGYSPLGAGVSLLPLTLLLVTLSRRLGAAAARTGPRTLLTGGPLAAALGVALLVRVGPRADYLREVLPAVVLLGLGLAATVAPLTATVLNAVAPEQAGAASGVNNAVARVAGLLAVALVGLVVSARYDAALPASAGALRGHPLVPPRSVATSLRAESADASASALHAAALAAAATFAAGGLVAFAGLGRRRRWHPSVR